MRGAKKVETVELNEVAKGTPGILVLEDGRFFEGFAIGDGGKSFGEMVFNTAMTGYQEVLTDPSYRSQIVAMTYPHIGNYGIQPLDGESGRPQVAGLVVRKLCRRPSHFGQRLGVGAYLARYGVSGIEGIDTRALVRHIRDGGAKAAVVKSLYDSSMLGAEVERLAGEARAWGEKADWSIGRFAGAARPYVIEPRESSRVRGSSPVLVAYDFGLKEGILRQLQTVGCRVNVVPSTFPAEAVMAMKPDGIFLSNGPGDPRALPEIVTEIKGLLGAAPIFGICLGHQLLALALGADVEKMRFGHRGVNHPVLDRTTGDIEITSQNHGYAVVEGSLPEHVEVTHINLNDGTVEGIRASAGGFPIFSVQYHPEACPGPHDSHHLFHRFIDHVFAARA
jgi:carbamoyl-phosphate synthase small subunit